MSNVPSPASRAFSQPPPEAGAAPERAVCRSQVISFDFGDDQGLGKSEREITLDEMGDAMDQGSFVWLDLVAGEAGEARAILKRFALEEDVIEAALSNEPSTQHARYDEYLHLVVSGCRQRGDQFDLERVDVVVGERFFLTIHRHPAVFLQSVKRDYRADFMRFARSPSFLMYELWDHLLDNYLSVQKKMEERVEQLQEELRTEEVEDAVFAQISALGADLLHFRKILLPARAVLSDLSTRKSLFVSEATQTFLGNMVGTLEHVLQDLLVDREILSDSLNLYMSLVSHRTNMVMKRLTVVSVVFLPLTFLVGVYGMNFEFLPELKWRYGYAMFWAAVFGIVGVLIVLMRRARLL